MIIPKFDVIPGSCCTDGFWKVYTLHNDELNVHKT